jgi:spore coat polysaccharide biosynthesis protein SpsF (cytidylyltransferase family)
MLAIFISVRANSTRLPNKAVLDICGLSTIEYVIQNMKKSKFASEIILCTTLLQSDDILCRIAKKNDIKYFRGSTEDKLTRWQGACEKYDVDFFVNVDGDDLFFDFGLADLVFDQHSKNQSDFIDGRGLYNDVYGISRKGIDLVCKNKKNTDTEFIKTYFDNIESLIKTQKLNNVPSKYHKKKIRMTLDYIEDFDFFTTIIKYFKNKKEHMCFEAILEYLNENPDVVQINWHKEQAWKDNQGKMISKITKEGL